MAFSACWQIACSAAWLEENLQIRPLCQHRFGSTDWADDFCPYQTCDCLSNFIHQLPLSPVRFLSIGVELPHAVAV
jgi:hypothetical protein